MKDHWADYLVEEIAAKRPYALATGPFGSSIGSRFFQTEGIPVIRGGNLSQDVGIKLVDEDWVFVSSKKAREFSRSVVRSGDLIFTSWGTIDQIGLIDEGSPYTEYVISNKQMKLTPDATRFDSHFLYYIFKSPAIRDVILSRGIGSSVPGFNLGQLRRMRISAPPLAAQTAIAGVLGALDGKIGLNRKMNLALENIASDLFKSWFIDFDPVTARRDGRTPIGVPPDVVDLFSRHFDELQRIPERWSMKPFTEIVEILAGGTPKTSVAEYWDGEIPWFSVVDAPAKGQVFVDGTERTITDRGLAESAAELILPGATIVTARGTVGKLALIARPMAMNQSCYAVRGREGFGPYFVYFATAELVDELQARATGSVFDTIIRVTFSTVRAAVPPLPLVAAYEGLVSPIMDTILTNGRQNETLTQLRDLLLTPLLTGKITLKAAEKTVAEVV